MKQVRNVLSEVLADLLISEQPKSNGLEKAKKEGAVIPLLHIEIYILRLTVDQIDLRSLPLSKR